MDTVLIVPGLGGSSEDHWQTWLQHQEEQSIRVYQDEWCIPDLGKWAARVREAVDEAPGPVWLVAHSFGCLASVVAASEDPSGIAGAMLVAPADPNRVGATSRLPTHRLPFPTLMIASTTDPWLKLSAAARWATRWGSRLINLGTAGHINVDSGYGPWPEGLALLRQLQVAHELKPSIASGTHSTTQPHRGAGRFDNAQAPPRE